MRCLAETVPTGVGGWASPTYIIIGIMSWYRKVISCFVCYWFVNVSELFLNIWATICWTKCHQYSINPLNSSLASNFMLRERPEFTGGGDRGFLGGTTFFLDHWPGGDQEFFWPMARGGPRKNITPSEVISSKTPFLHVLGVFSPSCV